MPNNPLVETWQIHDGINLYLLDAVDPSSQIALTLKQAGEPLDKKIAYGIWEWGVR